MNDIRVDVSEGLPPALAERFVSQAAFDPEGAGVAGGRKGPLAGASSLQPSPGVSSSATRRR